MHEQSNPPPPQAGWFVVLQSAASLPVHGASTGAATPVEAPPVPGRAPPEPLCAPPVPPGDIPPDGDPPLLIPPAPATEASL